MAAVLMRMALPKLGATRDKGAVRSAKQQVASYLANARAAAIRRSQPTQFYLSSSLDSITVGAAGARTRLGMNRLTQLGVSIAATSPGNIPDSILFDARGIATNLASAGRVYKFTRNGLTDSVCISKLGLVSRFC